MTENWGHFVFIDDHQITDVSMGRFNVNTTKRESAAIKPASVREEMPIYNLADIGSPARCISECKNLSGQSLYDDIDYDCTETCDEEKEGKCNCSAWSLFCYYPNARFNRRLLFMIFYLGIQMKCIATNIKFTQM